MEYYTVLMAVMNRIVLQSSLAQMVKRWLMFSSNVTGAQIVQMVQTNWIVTMVKLVIIVMGGKLTPGNLTPDDNWPLREIDPKENLTPIWVIDSRKIDPQVVYWESISKGSLMGNWFPTEGRFPRGQFPRGHKFPPWSSVSFGQISLTLLFVKQQVPL